MREKLMVIFISLFIVLVDLYSFKGLKLLLENVASLYRNIIFIIYWIIPFSIILVLVYFFSQHSLGRDPVQFKRFYVLGGFFILIYIPKLIFITFHFVEDLVCLIRWIVSKISMTGRVHDTDISNISRSRFISQLGFIIAIIPFVSILHGILIGRFNFRVEKKKLRFTNLPKVFDGYKLVHISDMHIGSFLGHQQHVEKAIELINAQNPDLILFTGDLVNNFYEELEGWIPILSKLNAKYGKFSILGNHDYGDYYRWKNNEDKKQNQEKIKQAHKKIGFKLLLNEFHDLEFKKEKITIVGVENWGLPPFPQYGDLKKAMSGIDDSVFKILLSHDPSHWSAEVVDNTNIDLTLSGHTHGMQFGVRVGNLKWSPAKYKYPNWAGLYEKSKQYLYVNRGFGYIGFPGRVGMPPEITLIELFSA
ncbi:MAG: metallophosphoesterase [Bacteroidales bacterium]|nr:metallophosphoesterase [Bacteroidales bacterium]